MQTRKGLFGCTGSWAISRGVVGDPAPREAQSWGAVRSDVSTSAWTQRGRAGRRWQPGFPPLPLPQGAPQPGLRAGGSRGGAKQRERRPWVLRSGCCCWCSCWCEWNYSCRVSSGGAAGRPRGGGGGWGTRRPRRAHLLSFRQSSRMRTCCFQVRGPGRASLCRTPGPERKRCLIFFFISFAPGFENSSLLACN